MLRVALKCINPVIQDELIAVLRGFPNLLVLQGKIVGQPELVILEGVDQDPDQTLLEIRSLLNEAESTEVFVTSTQNDPAFILDAYRAGVKEFLPQPLDTYVVAQAVSRFIDRHVRRHGAKSLKGGSILPVMGSKTGVGVTSVAINLARAIVRESPDKRIAVMDLDIAGSEITLFTNVDKYDGVRELVKDLSRLDEAVVAASFSNPEPGIFVLPAGYSFWSQEVPEAGSIVHLLSLIARQFDFIILDCGCDLRQHVQEALALASHISLVTTIELAAVRRARVFLDLENEYKKKGDRPRVELILNRHQPDQNDLIGKAEELLGQKFLWLVPNDVETAQRAILEQSSPLKLAPRSALAVSYRKQARHIALSKADMSDSKPASTPGKTSLLSRLLSRNA